MTTWIAHVKKSMKAHPGLPLRKVLKKASLSWKKMKKSKKPDKPCKPCTRRRRGQKHKKTRQRGGKCASGYTDAFAANAGLV